MERVKHDGRWAREIIALQRDDGTWGNSFHSLSAPAKRYPLTTEQALRRLRVLGYTIDDAPVRRTVDCMIACLEDKRKIDDYREKTHDWDLFTKLMLSAWVKIFDPDNEYALTFARRWARVIELAFANGAYDHNEYTKAYEDEFGIKPRGGREIDYISFYQVNLLNGTLAPETESLVFDHILSHPHGIYYFNYDRLDIPPTEFASRNTSSWLASLEILAEYNSVNEKLKFAADWLKTNRNADGRWDMGPKANDRVYFPLSDSWRDAGSRIADCTERVEVFLKTIGH